MSADILKTKPKEVSTMYNPTNTAAATNNTAQQQTKNLQQPSKLKGIDDEKKEQQEQQTPPAKAEEKTAPIEKKKTPKVKAGVICETLFELPKDEKNVNVKISAKVYAELDKVKELYNGHLDKQQLINYLLLQHANIFGV